MGGARGVSLTYGFVCGYPIYLRREAYLANSIALSGFVSVRSFPQKHPFLNMFKYSL